ncbi:YdcF family protein [Oleiagrimonas sp. C23AA]|uniref:YdcF family protein n=1 Tax=Oleiagrimonas sp. C23AA TaxID=2719047 RepID=UPI00142069B6|nr:YdcF family protein [Oleiagrimonas sp. C23AA]NII10885.1 YdcF family protein [Oleiagrimonas sp. C23AA]
MSDPLRPVRRGPWRYLRDADVLHALAVVMVALAASGGLVWLGYIVHVWQLAARSRLRPSRAGVVLVFGRRLVDDRPEADYRQRLRRCLRLMRAGTAVRVLLLGGASGGRISEAQAGADWLRANQAPAAVPVTLEQASIDSLENLRHARSLLGEPLPPVQLVTSRYHLARCRHLARRLGFQCQLIAAEPRLPRTLRYARRIVLEAGYLMWIDLGLRWAHLIGHRRMAERIT